MNTNFPHVHMKIQRPPLPRGTNTDYDEKPNIIDKSTQPYAWFQEQSNHIKHPALLNEYNLIIKAARQQANNMVFCKHTHPVTQWMELFVEALQEQVSRARENGEIHEMTAQWFQKRLG